jgi:alpha-L-arabinofuranosidase
MSGCGLQASGTMWPTTKFARLLNLTVLFENGRRKAVGTPFNSSKMRFVLGEAPLRNRALRLTMPTPGHRQERSFVVTFGVIGLVSLAAILFVVVLKGGATASGNIRNGGFEASVPGEFWVIDGEEAKQAFSLSLDGTSAKEGRQSLLITAVQPVNLTLRQEVFLPIGTLWRLTGWEKSEASPASAGKDQSEVPSPGPRIGIEAQVGDQGFSQPVANAGEWQRASFVFRVPSPGRMTIALNIFNNQSGNVWLDGIELEPVAEVMGTEPVVISDHHLNRRPIDRKQGGQFIEPLCDVMPSMIAQQVRSTSFEEETPWNYTYKAEVDKPYRPWYPDGTVHAATYSFDTNKPFNGKRSQKIELPLANTWAGISQDGFYLDANHGYRLRLHVRGAGNVPVRASLHGNGEMIAGPVSLGRATSDWTSAEAVLTAKRSVSNATLTIEFEGPGTLWLDRVYLIDGNAVLGLWRRDVVQALKAMNPGIVRLGGSNVEEFEWSDTIGDWDTRVPFPDPPWGGLQENFVGVEEFVRLVQFLGAEPLICLRWTKRTPQDAANEVEYFNGGADTKWGALRARNGHREPYHVKYWQVGNEVGGPEYDASLVAFGEAMRQVDPSIKISSSFPSRDTVRVAGKVLDFLAPHQYSVGDLNGTENELKQLQEDIRRDGNGKDIRLSVTEWNATAGDWGLKRGMLHTLGNALVCSRYQNMMHRYSDLIEIANVSNVSHSFAGGQLQPGPGWLYMIPDYYAQLLYQRAAGSYSLRVDRSSPLSFYLREPDLDATISGDGKTLRIYAVNSTTESRNVKFTLPDSFGRVQSAQVFVLGDSNAVPDSEAMNLPDRRQRVSVQHRTAEFSGREFSYRFDPFSVTLLEIQLAGKNSMLATGRNDN